MAHPALLPRYYKLSRHSGREMQCGLAGHIRAHAAGAAIRLRRYFDT